MKTLDVLAATLLVIGGLNWGLVGLLGIDLVAISLGEISLLSRLVYLLVGSAGVYQALAWRSIQKRWALAWASYS
jgi:uncharacterized membrane protein YuzA (DUF378 family)